MKFVGKFNKNQNKKYVVENTIYFGVLSLLIYTCMYIIGGY
jgi:hypothetical protein